MGSITFIEHDGSEHKAEIEAGKSLMQLAIDNSVPGIDADCGGSCACGTCHVVVAKTWSEKSGAASDSENQMLELTPERKETSRLSCQVEVKDTMDGMVVYLPEFQM